MKKTFILLLGSMIIFSCNKAQSNDSLEETDFNDSITREETTEENKKFNIESITISKEDIGDFPFFNLPEGLKTLNKNPIERDYDIIYFPMDGIMTPIEGKTYKSNITVEDRKKDTWSLPYFLKSYDDAILKVGGQKIFDGQISKEEYKRYSKEATYLGESGSIGYSKEIIKVYAIRRENGDHIYIQLTGNNAGGKLNILQEKGFTQTITKITADDIVKDLNEKGKSILYINFETDKSTLTIEGQDIVSQISSALKNNASLKISIEGHTDNTGDANHNKKLSNDRANSVLESLLSQGIDKSRLSSKGLGAENPLVPNDSEDNKAKNRRVELIKLN